MPRLKCRRVRLSAPSPHSSYLLACGLSGPIRHAKCRAYKDFNGAAFIGATSIHLATLTQVDQSGKHVHGATSAASFA